MTYFCPFCKETYRLKISLYAHLAKDRCNAKPYSLTQKELTAILRALKSVEEGHMRDFEGRLR